MEARDIISTLKRHIRADAQHYYRHSDYWHYGLQQTPERVAAVAELVVREYPGDLVEIGCAKGVTSRRLAKIAAEHGRKLIAVDPWENGGLDPEDFDEFLENIKRYRDSVTILPMKSQRPEVTYRLGLTRLCFAYVDGEHTYDALASDLVTVSHAPVIAVDDILWDWRLLRAFHEASENRQPIRHPWCNEGYIL